MEGLEEQHPESGQEVSGVTDARGLTGSVCQCDQIPSQRSDQVKGGKTVQFARASPGSDVRLEHTTGGRKRLTRIGEGETLSPEYLMGI